MKSKFQLFLLLLLFPVYVVTQTIPIQNPSFEGLALARSEVYISISRTTQKVANYNMPCILRIWGGNNGEREMLLAQTTPITPTNWEIYTLNFRSNGSYRQVFLETYYAPDITELYNGNLLVDHLRLSRIQ